MAFSGCNGFDFEEKMNQLSSHRLFPLAVLLLGVLVLVGLAQTVRFRIDLTEEKRYSLHPSTLKLLEGIDRPLHVDILLTGEQLPGGMRRLQKSIEETVRTFNAYSSENITVSYFDPLEVTDSLKEEFIYTLKPPLLGDNSVDEFLFKTRRGFCEHFADRKHSSSIFHSRVVASIQLR